MDTPVRSLSLGQRMRADICAALLHDPIILFLDEPTIGLDVVAKERIRQFIQHINKERKTTVLLTTHDLSDVEKLCKRVMIIDHGLLLFDGQLETLRDRFGGKRQLVVEYVNGYEQVDVAGAEITHRDGPRVTYQFDRETTTASELIGRISAKYRLRDLEVREPEIEDTIRRIYEEKLLEDHTLENQM
jgi:ABC-2 type transport system ATP-binding protein